MLISDIANSKTAITAITAALLGSREREEKVYIIYHKDLYPKVEIETPAVFAVSAVLPDSPVEVTKCE